MSLESSTILILRDHCSQQIHTHSFRWLSLHIAFGCSLSYIFIVYFSTLNICCLVSFTPDDETAGACMGLTLVPWMVSSSCLSGTGGVFFTYWCPFITCCHQRGKENKSPSSAVTLGCVLSLREDSCYLTVPVDSSHCAHPAPAVPRRKDLCKDAEEAGSSGVSGRKLNGWARSLFTLLDM